jgi:hypothetical protein
MMHDIVVRTRGAEPELPSSIRVEPEPKEG